MRKQILHIGCLVLLCCLLSACAGTGKVADTPIVKTTVILEEGGRVTHTIMETFNQSYYDIKELETSVKQELDAYAEEKGTGLAVLKQCALVSSDARIDLSYASPDDFQYFNTNDRLFFGTFEEAKAEGFDVEVNYVKAGSEKTAFMSALSQKGYHVWITNLAVDVRTSQDILYYYTSGTYVSEREIDTTGQNGYTIIVVK